MGCKIWLNPCGSISIQHNLGQQTIHLLLPLDETPNPKSKLGCFFSACKFQDGMQSSTTRWHDHKNSKHLTCNRMALSYVFLCLSYVIPPSSPPTNQNHPNADVGFETWDLTLLMPSRFQSVAKDTARCVLDIGYTSKTR